MQRLAHIVVTLTVGIAYPAIAQGRQFPVQSRESLVESMTQMFERFDRDRDGRWNLTEMLAMAEVLEATDHPRQDIVDVLTCKFDRDDADDNGFLSLEEMMAQILAHHDEMDDNGDGLVADAEWLTFDALAMAEANSCALPNS